MRLIIACLSVVVLSFFSAASVMAEDYAWFDAKKYVLQVLPIDAIQTETQMVVADEIQPDTEFVPRFDTDTSMDTDKVPVVSGAEVVGDGE